MSGLYWDPMGALANVMLPQDEVCQRTPKQSKVWGLDRAASNVIPEQSKTWRLDKAASNMGL